MQKRHALAWRGIDNPLARRRCHPVVHGGVGHTGVLVPDPLSKVLGGCVLVPECALHCRPLSQNLHAAGRCPNEERNVPHKAVDALVEEIIAAGVIPAAPRSRHRDLCREHDLVRYLEVHRLATFDDCIEVPWSASLHAHTIVVVRAVCHVWREPDEDKVVPVRGGVGQWCLSFAVHVGVDHVRDAVVDADDHARLRRCIKQTQTQVLRRVS
mmetsp:Transcript_66947/g.189920  ORF Transcript_66947/g.189920 Transcript_66947/m.189920 type:complete len:212 (+) Transcript_66947:1726-2361(+)